MVSPLIFVNRARREWARMKGKHLSPLRHEDAPLCNVAPARVFPPSGRKIATVDQGYEAVAMQIVASGRLNLGPHCIRSVAGQPIGALIIGMAGMSLDPSPVDLVAASRLDKRLP